MKYYSRALESKDTCVDCVRRDLEEFTSSNVQFARDSVIKGFDGIFENLQSSLMKWHSLRINGRLNEKSVTLPLSFDPSLSCSTALPLLFRHRSFSPAPRSLRVRSFEWVNAVEFDASSGKWDPATSDGPDTLTTPIDIFQERGRSNGQTFIRHCEKVAESIHLFAKHYFTSNQHMETFQEERSPRDPWSYFSNRACTKSLENDKKNGTRLILPDEIFRLELSFKRTYVREFYSPWFLIIFNLHLIILMFNFQRETS